MALVETIKDSKILDLVLMNEELCFHQARFGEAGRISAFAKPEAIIVNKKDEGRVEAYIRCPVCGNKYKEASKRFLKMVKEER